jgi:hypothetical protein
MGRQPLEADIDIDCQGSQITTHDPSPAVLGRDDRLHGCAYSTRPAASETVAARGPAVVVFPPMEAPTLERTQRVSCAVAAVVAALSWGCSRTIEEDKPRELVEHRLEPCRQWCTPMLSSECGARPEDRAFRTVDECVESCADVKGGWEWARQEDGTDACAEEWFMAADCMDALSCEEQRDYFWTLPATDHDYPCKAELDAKRHCFYSTPNIEREED